MPVTPQSLRNAADFMMRQTGEKPTWLYEAADDIERLTIQLGKARAALAELLEFAQTQGNFQNGVVHNCIDEGEVHASDFFSRAFATILTLSDEKSDCPHGMSSRSKCSTCSPY